MSLNFSSLKNILSLPFQQAPKADAAETETRLYHYVHENEMEKSRIHLRIDPDGTGTLIVNASSVMHLNPTAAFMAWLILEGKTEDERVQALRARYSVSKNRPAKTLQSSITNSKK